MYNIYIKLWLELEETPKAIIFRSASTPNVLLKSKSMNGCIMNHEGLLVLIPFLLPTAKITAAHNLICCSIIIYYKESNSGFNKKETYYLPLRPFQIHSCLQYEFPVMSCLFSSQVPVLIPMDLMVEASPRRVFANAHTYHINSISVNSDNETYLSADDLRINLWHLEITDRSFSILKYMRPCVSEHLPNS